MIGIRHLALSSALVLGLGITMSAPAQDEEAPTPLQEAMGTLMGGMRQLRPLVADPAANQATIVEVLHGMQAAVLSAIQNPPEPPQGFPEGGVFTWRINYQRKMLELADALFEAELGAHRGKADEIGAALGKANEIKKVGHDVWK